MDIVYAFKQSEANDSEELRYSLRSLQNLPHDRVFVVGEKPSWLRKAVHISVPQSDTKYRNVSRNIQTAISSPDISDDFIFMNDDFFVMKPFDALPVLHWGPMRKIIDRFTARYEEESSYIKKMKDLYRALIECGYEDPLSYELHVPMILNKAKVKHMYSPEFGRIYQFRTMYGNYFKIGGEYTEDVKVYLEPRHNDPGYQDDPIGYLEKMSLLSATGGSFREGEVGQYIRSVFSRKSIYEA